MTLSRMIETDEAALVCDFAETYHIFDYKALPAATAALLASGLRESSRIKLKMAGLRYTSDTLLLAAILDRLTMIQWFQTQDGQRNRNRPESVFDRLTGTAPSKDIKAFSSGDAFRAEFERITKGGDNR